MHLYQVADDSWAKACKKTESTFGGNDLTASGVKRVSCQGRVNLNSCLDDIKC